MVGDCYVSPSPEFVVDRAIVCLIERYLATDGTRWISSHTGVGNQCRSFIPCTEVGDVGGVVLWASHEPAGQGTVKPMPAERRVSARGVVLHV